MTKDASAIILTPTLNSDKKNRLITKASLTTKLASATTLTPTLYLNQKDQIVYKSIPDD